MTLEDAVRALAAVSDTPRLDAGILLAHACSASPSVARGTVERSETLPATAQPRSRSVVPLASLGEAAFDALVARRLNYEPVAYITGTRGFWTIDLDVTPAVLIPRPDSETLIEAALAHFGTDGPRRILDLGTGSGALLLAALDQWPEATGVGVDTSEDALQIATQNAERIALGRADMRLGDWADRIDEAFDLVLCNPPYVENGTILDAQVRDFEPPSALFAGLDGLDAYRALVPMLARVTGGIACIEIGHEQAAAVTALLENECFSVTSRKDLAAHDRCLIATKK